MLGHAFLTLVILVVSSPGSSSAPTASGGGEAVYLCSALEAVEPGDALPVHLSGILMRAPEHSLFFDPEQPLCSWDVQPSTWTEIVPDAPGRENLPRGLGVTAVTVRGILHGPPPVGPDDLRLNPVVTYANRIAGRRYGHLGAFRTKLVIEEILEATPASPQSAQQVVMSRPGKKESLTVLEASVPEYSKYAQRAGISGEVAIEVVVQDGGVVSATVLSGDRLLGVQAVADIETWRFPEDTEATFTTLFVYRLERKLAGAARTPTIELELPWLVRITAAENGW